MSENEFTYWAFISYSLQDNCERRLGAATGDNFCWGDWLNGTLKTFLVPAAFSEQINAHGEIVPERINSIFQDQTENSSNSNLSENVRKSLEQSKYLVVICSPRAAKSLHVNEAVRYFKQLGRGQRILPIVIAGEPNAVDGNKPGMSPDDECFVPALRHPVKANGTLDISRRELGSIFADARHGETKREIVAKDYQAGAIELETAKIQLIAGILGVGFNGLWAHEVKRLFAEAKNSTRETSQPIQQAETPGLTPETQNEILAARNEARAAQQKIQELQNEAQAAQSKVLEAQQQARDAQAQLEEARNQIREAQNKFLEVQNLPHDVKSQIEEAQAAARAAQSQVEESRMQAQKAQSEIEAVRNEARESESKFLEAQNQVRAAQSRVQEIETQARQTQSQLEAAQNQARLAEGKVLEAQQLAREAQGQVAEARNQVSEAQNKISGTQNQTRVAQSQLEAARNEAREVQGKLAESQNQVRAVQSQVQEIQTKSQGAQRLTKIFAVLAVLALMAAGSLALWQQKKLAEARAKAESTPVTAPELVSGPLNREQIQQALQKFAGVSNDPNLLRSLDELATRIPTEEISNTLNTVAVALNDPQRSRFQEQLLDFWAKTNWPAAFDWTCQLTNVDSRQRALEKVIPVFTAENPTNTLARLNELKPVPSESLYTQLFQRWATKDPVQAIDQRKSIPSQDADDKILSASLTVWADQQPASALNWLQSQPGLEALPAGAARNTQIAALFEGWAAKDLEAATTACQQLPDGSVKEKVWENILSRRIAMAPEAAAELVKNLPPGDYRQKAIVELCSHWVGATNAPAVLDWAQTLPAAAERVAVTNQVVITWAKNDPAAATQFAGAHPELNNAVFGDLATAWFQRDVAATTNWVASLPDGEKKDAARLALMEVWAQNDPKGLLTYGLALPAGDVQTLYLTAASSRLAVQDLPATVELLQPLADAGLRQNILEQAARRCDASHIHQAAKFIASMPAGDDQKAAIKGLIATWAPADPEASLNWLVAFPATNSQPELAQSVIKTWAQPEPSVVAKWFANLPAEVANEGLIGAFLDGATTKYPDYAAQWTQSVTDEAQRQKYQIQVARQWMKTDSSAATKWIDSLSLPEETKQSIKTPSP